MKIRFTKFRLYANLILGAIWIFLGTYYFIFDEITLWFGYVYFILGILYITHFLYDQKNQYLIIEKRTIKKNILYGFKNKMDLDEIQDIQKIKGDFILKSDIKKLKIKVDLIDNSSLLDLIEVLRNLNLPSEKTFLAN